MLSILLTTKDKETTFEKSFAALYKAVTFFVSATNMQTQILVVTPKIYNFLHTYHSTYLIKTEIVQDPGKGKPEALNIGIKKAEGTYVLFTDGDVIMKENAILELYEYTVNNKLAIAGGHPVPLSNKKSMMGYWAWVLFEGNAHRLRKQTEEKRMQGIKKYFPVSGYLFMVEKSLYPHNKKNMLAEDAYTSYILHSKGYAIGYNERAIVYVQFPKKYADYVRQKIRTLGGNVQKEHISSNTRSFFAELKGIVPTLTYAQTVKELYWSLLLLGARLHTWGIVFLHKKLHKDTVWKEIDSSKEI